ncbi:MAG: ABC-type dipeptide transport system, periplasmic component [Acidimicrobiales bacterium]|nr:ABC-type dipeptide transport system, periplasmic component [Acidimicrobiales bacterium]
MPHSSRVSRSARSSFAAIVVGLALVAAACGGGSGSSSAGGTSPNGSKGEGPPQSGGSITYGLGAESSNGFCLSGANLSPEGIQVAESIYDTLTVPNEKGDYVPYLAKSVAPSSDYKEWVITLRPGVLFHDGTPFDAAAVKLNLDAYRHGLLIQFAFANIADTTVVDPMTVKVTMKVPWVAFPAYLYFTGRIGMMAPAQINDKANCATKMIGTGPFTLKDWVVNDHLTVLKNQKYWRPGLPYLDQITFRPVVDPSQRTNGLKGGQLNIIHTDSALQIKDLRDAAAHGQLTIFENQKGAEVSYNMMNVSHAPFDDITARQAVILATDRVELNNIVNGGVNTIADQPFAPDVVGYVPDPGYPKFDLAAAKVKADAYKAKHGGQFNVEVETTIDPENAREAQLLKSQWAKAGINATIKQVDEATLISDAIGGGYQMNLWRNHQGSDPDTQWVWWHGGSAINFQRFKDPAVDQIFDIGRSDIDPAKRKTDYDGLSKALNAGAYDIWKWYALWAIASQTNVHGITGPDLPDGGGKQGLLASVHPMVGLWVSK